jgi:hypothetical protein
MLDNDRIPLAIGLPCTLLFAALGCTGNIGGTSGGGDPNISMPPPGSMTQGPGSSTTSPPGGILPPANGADGKPCVTDTFTPARLWRLSDDQFKNAVTDLLPGIDVPTVSTPGRSRAEFINFAEALPVNSALASDIRDSVESVARKASSINLGGLLGCKTGQAPDTCIDDFIAGFAARAFRRPLDNEEKTGLRAVYEAGAADGQAEGVRLVVGAILQAPSFLYRSELGAAPAAGKPLNLTTYELASALSFFLLDSIPDAPLWAAAQDGSLARTDVYEREVQRLLALPRVQKNLTLVMIKWVGLGEGISIDLGDKVMEFTPELKTSMEEENRLFFSSLLTGGGTLTDLLTSTKGFVDKRLAANYGVTAPATGFGEINYPADERAGILTQGAILSRYSIGTPVVLRGKYVRDQLLCGEIPDPPNIPDIDAENTLAANLPEREQVRRRLANAVCGSCHTMMDPIGLTFSRYDALARYRAKADDGSSIDSSGSISGAGDVDGPVMSAVDLGQKLASSPTVRACIEQKFYSYALGRLPETFDSCELKRIDAHVQTKGGKLAELAAALVYSSAFRQRTGGK